jgi:hypothetical protein
VPVSFAFGAGKTVDGQSEKSIRPLKLRSGVAAFSSGAHHDFDINISTPIGNLSNITFKESTNYIFLANPPKQAPVVWATQFAHLCPLKGSFIDL